MPVRATLGVGSSVRGSRRDDDVDGEGKHQGVYLERKAVAEVEAWIAITELVLRAVKVLSRQVSGVRGLTHWAMASKDSDTKGILCLYT